MRSILMNTAALTVAAMPRAFDNTAATPKAARVEPAFTSASKITLPTRTNRRGSESKYPFDSLTEAGMAFGVKNKNAQSLSSIISNANRKNMTPKTDEAGNALYETKELAGQDGTKTVVPDTSKPKMVATKKFFAFDVTPEYKKANVDMFKKDAPFEGATTLVFREL